VTRRRVVGVWVVLAGIVAGYACEPDRRVPMYLEDFEGELCEGSPCDWSRTSGTPGQATYVETIHPGEHALRLTGDVNVRGPGSDVTLPGPEIRVRMTVRCDAGARLTVGVIISDDLGTRPLRFEAFAPTRWAETTVTVGGGGEIAMSRLAAVELTKTGSGSCELAEIMIENFRGAFGDDIVC